MFILQMDQVVPMLSWPKSERSRGVAAALANIVARLDQHAAGAAGGVVDAHVRLRIDDLDECPHHIRRRVELARLLPCRVGEEFDEVFVGGAEQVGKLEVLVPQRNLLEVLDEVGERVVVERALADLPVEVDMLQHILKRIDIGIFQRFEGLVEAAADIGLEMADFRPVRQHVT